MPVPERRNQKKHHHGHRSPYSVQSRSQRLSEQFTGRLTLEEEAQNKPTFEEWLDQVEHPGDWLENEYHQEPERLLQPNIEESEDDGDYYGDGGDGDYYGDEDGE